MVAWQSFTGFTAQLRERTSTADLCSQKWRYHVTLPFIVMPHKSIPCVMVCLILVVLSCSSMCLPESGDSSKTADCMVPFEHAVGKTKHHLRTTTETHMRKSL